MKQQSDEWEKFGLDVMEGRLRGPRFTLLRILLHFLSYVFSGIIRLRLRLFGARVVREGNLGCLVVSIGNLTVGGTGKTPVVESLARALKEGGRSVAILSRGYKRERKKIPLGLKIRARLSGRKIADPVMVVSSPDEVLLAARIAGDEPHMLANNLPGIPVVVHKNRVRSGRHAIREFGVDTLVLDDGLQYLRLRHSIDLVLVDSTKPFGTGHMLPRGTLREPPRSLRRASYVFLTKCEQAADPKLIEQIRKHNPVAEILQCRHQPLYLENLETGVRRDLATLKGAYVGTLSGIASPESFERGVKKLGANIVLTRRFPDHHRFADGEVEGLMDRCVRRDVEFIVTTEKDAVRFPELRNSEVPVYFLRVEIEITEGKEIWDRLVERICRHRAEAPARLIDAPDAPEGRPTAASAG